MRVQEGQGWRLVLDPDRQPFCALIGGSGWAVELTRDEVLALAEGVTCLQDQHRQIADQLMADEDLGLDWQRNELWIGLSLNRGQWDLRFVLEGVAGRRSVEAGWEGGASQAVALALEEVPGLLSSWGDGAQE
jgi:hypothetical protein